MRPAVRVDVAHRANGADESGLLRRHAPLEHSRRRGRRERGRFTKRLMRGGRVGRVGGNSVCDLFSYLVVLSLIFGSERRPQSRRILFQFALALRAELLTVCLSDESIELPDTRPI